MKVQQERCNYGCCTTHHPCASHDLCQPPRNCISACVVKMCKVNTQLTVYYDKTWSKFTNATRRWKHSTFQNLAVILCHCCILTLCFQATVIPVCTQQSCAALCSLHAKCSQACCTIGGCSAVQSTLRANMAVTHSVRSAEATCSFIPSDVPPCCATLLLMLSYKHQPAHSTQSNQTSTASADSDRPQNRHTYKN